MFAEERQQQILLILAQEKAVKVKQLSKRFLVADETIRRDLEKLEKDNKLKRTHGGAISIQDKDDDDIPFQDRKILMKREKKAMAKEAVKLIKEEETIFIDASSTGLYLAMAIPNMKLKVMTNSLPVAYELAKRTSIQLILTGGNLTPSSMSLVGSGATRVIQNYNISKLFLSCIGFDNTWGISDSNELQADVKREAMKMAAEVILMADYTKIQKKSFVQIANVAAIDIIITDNKVEKSYFNVKALKNVQVIFSE